MTQAWIDAGREAGAARAVLRLRRVSPAGAPHHLRHQRPQSGHRGVQSKTIRSAAGRSIRCPTLTNTGFTPLRVRSTVPMISPRSRRDELDPRLVSGSTKVPQSPPFRAADRGDAAHEPHVAGRDCRVKGPRTARYRSRPLPVSRGPRRPLLRRRGNHPWNNSSLLRQSIESRSQEVHAEHAGPAAPGVPWPARGTRVGHCHRQGSRSSSRAYSEARRWMSSSMNRSICSGAFAEICGSIRQLGS
jgi:hypothetical protein